MGSLLEVLKTKISLDCDTLDSKVAGEFGPFVDCTSNQAIAAAELARPGHEDLIARSLQQTRDVYDVFKHDGVKLEELAVDVMTVNLQAATLPNITGNVHIQTNPFFSYSTADMIGHAKKLLGIKTLATTLFTLEQATLAARCNCTYIAPYVNELKVHFVPGYRDRDPGFNLTQAAKLYYQQIHSSTKVMPASLTAVEEVLKLVGKADHITVAPHLLKKLAETSATGYDRLGEDVKVSSEVAKMSKPDGSRLHTDAASFKMAMTRSLNGVNEKKLVDAINIFCDSQNRLEDMVKRYAGRPTSFQS